MRQRTGFACEYCHLPEALYDGTFEIEHVLARQHGGPTRLSNLLDGDGGLLFSQGTGAKARQGPPARGWPLGRATGDASDIWGPAGRHRPSSSA